MSRNVTMGNLYIQLQPLVLPISLVKSEPVAVMKNERSGSEIVEITIDDILDSSDEDSISDIKDIDIVSHTLDEHWLKSETLESKHSESVETQVYVQTENTPYTEIENISQSENLNISEGTSDGNVISGPDQRVVEVQGSNALGNLQTNEQLAPNDQNNITTETVQSHEYTSLGKKEHICNYCQIACITLKNIKQHIKIMHRQATSMHQCPSCPFKTKWMGNLRTHIILKHKDTKDVQWFECHLCEKKFKLKCILSQHMKLHLIRNEMKIHRDRSTLCLLCGKGKLNHHKKTGKRYCCKRCEFVSAKYSDIKLHKLPLSDSPYRCENCNYKTFSPQNFKKHKIIHLKPEEIQYFYCYHCSHKFKHKSSLQNHISLHFRNQDVPFHCYMCNFTTPKRNLIFEHIRKHDKLKLHPLSRQTETEVDDWSFKSYYCDKCNYKTISPSHLKRHKLIHLNPHEIEYFHCYHCSYKSKHKGNLKTHIFRTCKNREIKYGKRYHCDKCDYETLTRSNLLKHKIIHLKPEEIHYFYCYHCSFKSKIKNDLKGHIFRHFKKGEVVFHCYICDFMTLKRELIIEHIKEHSNKLKSNSDLITEARIRVHQKPDKF